MDSLWRPRQKAPKPAPKGKEGKAKELKELKERAQKARERKVIRDSMKEKVRQREVRGKVAHFMGDYFMDKMNKNMAKEKTWEAKAQQAHNHHKQLYESSRLHEGGELAIDNYMPVETRRAAREYLRTFPTDQAVFDAGQEGGGLANAANSMLERQEYAAEEWGHYKDKRFDYAMNALHTKDVAHRFR